MTVDPTLASEIVALFGVASRSFLAYVVETSTPSISGEGDERLHALLVELRKKERVLEDRCRALIEEAGLRPSAPPFALSTSYFNFVRPETSARRFLLEAEEESVRLRALEKRLSAGEDVGGKLKRLAGDMSASRKAAIEAVQTALQPTEIPAPLPKAAETPPKTPTAAGGKA